jgi:hypothetical protein
MFIGGYSKAELKELELDPYHAAQVKSIHDIPEDCDDETKYQVDFVGVAASYLGSLFESRCNFDDMMQTCKIMANFYNYLMVHSVCEEYSKSILAARKLTEKTAPKELFMIKTATEFMPGHFHSACSALFGGHASTLQPGDAKFVDSNVARITILHALLASGDDELLTYISSQPEDWLQSVTCVTELETGLEVVSITPPTLEAKKMYHAAHSDKKPMVPVGLLACKAWTRDIVETFDLPRGYKMKSILPDTVTFWVEESILICLLEGMKLLATVRLLDFGGHGQLWVLDAVCAIYCSFYQPSLNELAMDAGSRLKSVKWKAPTPGKSLTGEDLVRM